MGTPNFNDLALTSLDRNTKVLIFKPKYETSKTTIKSIKATEKGEERNVGFTGDVRATVEEKNAWLVVWCYLKIAPRKQRGWMELKNMDCGSKRR